MSFTLLHFLIKIPVNKNKKTLCCQITPKKKNKTKTRQQNPQHFAGL